LDDINVISRTESTGMISGSIRRALTGVTWGLKQDRNHWNDFQVLSTTGINWMDFAVWVKTGINWNDFGVLDKVGINWNDFWSFSKTGINWNGLEY